MYAYEEISWRYINTIRNNEKPHYIKLTTQMSFISSKSDK